MGDDDIRREHWLPQWEPVVTRARARRGDVTVEESGRGGFQLRSFDFPLDFYANRGHVTAVQYRAGIRLNTLWRWSVLRLRYSQWNYGEQCGDFDPDDLLLAPRDYLAARAAITDAHARETVYRVCCEGKKAGKRGGMGLLRLGLDDLMTHFRMDN